MKEMKTEDDTQSDSDSVIQTDGGQDPAEAPVTIRESHKDPGEGRHQVHNSVAGGLLVPGGHQHQAGQPPLHHQPCVANASHPPDPDPVNDPLQTVQTHGLEHDPGPAGNQPPAHLEDEKEPQDITVAPDGGRPAVDLEDAGGQQDAPAPAVDHLQDADLQPVPEQQDAAVPAHDPEDDVHMLADGDSDEAVPDLSPEQGPVPEPAPADQQPQPGDQHRPPQPRQPPAMRFVGSKGVKIIRDLPKKKKK